MGLDPTVCRGSRSGRRRVDGGLAGFFLEPPLGKADGPTGVGPPRPVERLADFHRLAVRALMTARTCNLRGAYDISPLRLRSAVVMATNVGEVLRQRYLQPLTAGGSADDWLQCCTPTWLVGHRWEARRQCYSFTTTPCSIEL